MAQPSPSYVPRISRPSSPAMTPTSSAYVPRSSSTSRVDRGALTPRVPLERKSSGLRNEMKRESTQETQEMSEDAKSILKLLSNLPAPLPESLPPTFLPSPSASPRSTPFSSPPKTFTEYVHLKRKRDLEPDESDETKISGNSNEIGLGLGLTVAPDKKRKIEEARGITPSSPVLNGIFRKDKARSGLRNEVEVEEGEVGEGHEERVRRDLWKPEKWSQMGNWYRDRALLLKRHGDAYLRAPTAKPDFVKTLPADRLKGLLCLTDSALLYNYSHFCDEKAKAKPLPGIYDSSSGLRTFVRKEWEHEMRRGEGSDGEEGPKERERERERARAMAGLMYLLEAVIMYQTGKDSLAILQHRGKELHATLASPHDNPSPPGFIATPSPTNPSHNGSITASATTATANSNTGANHSSAHPPNHSPTSAHSSAHSPSSSTSSTLPPDLLPLIFNSFRQSSDASQYLHISRFHLTLRTLRHYFPTSYGNAIHSELADQALPAPGDSLGAAREVDPDKPARFAWPIEMGMCAPVAHVVAFGRGMVKEMAEREGRDWKLLLE
ncbi:hypothetical protein LQV05_005503 [Cryptococcus neoformans]|nr:hypothetical protein LQV05_005503 [Cryptococcus neoformans]